MNHITNVIEKLTTVTDKKQQESLLQEINKLVLTEYMIEIDHDLVIYPIEVEAYYYHQNNFPDTCVHKFELQKNRYGKLYFHRASNKEDAAFLFDMGGIDVCLSNSGDFYFGLLIRGAWINQENEPICTPGVLTRKVVQDICKDNTLEKISEKEAIIIRQYEAKDSIIKPAHSDPRDKDSILFHSTRFGIDPQNHPEYAPYKLRSLIELSAPKHPFRAKEKVVLDYMIEHKLEPTAENVRKLMGSNSNWVLNQLQNK